MNRLLFVVPFLLFFLSVRQNACQAQASAQGLVFADIIPVLSAAATAQMNFGQFLPSSGGGKIILSPDGSIISTGNVILGQGDHQSAKFYVTGEENAAYSVTLPSEPATLLNSDNSKSILVSDFISTPVRDAGMGLLAGGAQEISIGATLNVGPADQNPGGLYCGTFTIRFDYN